MIDGQKVLAEDMAEVLVKDEKFKWVNGQKQSTGFHRNTNSLMKAITKAYRRAAKKLISVGPVMLEDDLESAQDARELNLTTGDVVGGANTVDALNVALPSVWRGFKTLREMDDKDSELLSVLQKELTDAKASAKGLSTQWTQVLQVIEKHFA